MECERFHHIRALFSAAAGLPPGELAPFLGRACGDDLQLREEVESLIASDRESDSLGESVRESIINALALASPPVLSQGSPELDRVSDPAGQASPSIGPYSLLRRLGEGGMGEVWLAEQIWPLRRRVALKVIKAGMDTKSVLARFEAERQALALMDHPNIAKVLDAGETEQGRPYFVMDLVNGEPITVYCDRHALTIEERLGLFLQVCRAVQHAHKKGIIHRDLKPSNILVMLTDGKPTPQVIDFGIAKATGVSLTDRTLHTMKGMFVGTPAYMSPEQADTGGLHVDTRTDIYSLGVVLYELLTGSLPFDPGALRGAGCAEIQWIRSQQDPLKPSARARAAGRGSQERAKQRGTDPRTLSRQLRGELDWIVLKAMDKDRSRRYDSPDSLAMDIGSHLADRPVLAGPPSAVYRARKFVERNKVAIGVVVAVLISVSGALVQSNVQRMQIQSARDESEAVTAFLVEMLSSVDPAAQGQEITVSEALDSAVERIGERFSDRPLVEARLRHTLASTYHALGELREAESNAAVSVKIRRQNLGESDSEALQSMNLLGLTLSDQGRWDEAVDILRKSMLLGESHLGPYHPTTLESRRHLARSLTGAGRFAEAESVYREIVDLGEGARFDEHPGIRDWTRELAGVYRSGGRWDDAERLLRQLLEHERQRYGEEHPSTLKTMVALAHVHRESGRIEEAEELSRQVLERVRSLLGDDHPQSSSAMSSLATVLMDQGHLDEATVLFREILTAYRRTMHEDHPDLIGTVNALAMIAFRSGRFDEAEALHRSVLAARARVLGSDHLLTLASQRRLAFSLQAQGRFAAAESCFREVLLSRSRTRGSDHGLTLSSMQELAGILELQGRFAEAESLYVDAVRTRSRIRGDEAVWASRSMLSLSRLYQKQARDAEADSLHHRILLAKLREDGGQDPPAAASEYAIGCVACH